VFVSAVEGFEFATLAPSMLDSTHPASDQRTSGLYLQSGGVSNMEMSSKVVGEKFRSVKQLMMVPDWHVFDAANTSITDFWLFPFFRKFYVPSVTGTTPLPDSSQALYYGGKVGRVLDMYAFCNGSTLWTITHDAPNSSYVGLSVIQRGNDAGTSITDVASIYNRDLLWIAVLGCLPTTAHYVLLYQRIANFLVFHSRFLIGQQDLLVRRCLPPLIPL
jgi:hypothetical protein